MLNTQFFTCIRFYSHLHVVHAVFYIVFNSTRTCMSYTQFLYILFYSIRTCMSYTQFLYILFYSIRTCMSYTQ
jgi:hypothetical protein